MDIYEELEWNLDHDAPTWSAYRNYMGTVRVDLLVLDFITIRDVTQYLRSCCIQEVLTNANKKRTDPQP